MVKTSPNPPRKNRRWRLIALISVPVLALLVVDEGGDGDDICSWN